MSGFIITSQTVVGSGSNPIGVAGGDLTGTYPDPIVDSIGGASVPDSSSIPDGYTLQISGADTLIYAPINLAGGPHFVVGSLPISNQISQNLTGDVSGTTAAATVTKINGATIPVAGSLTTGNILQVGGSSNLSYGPLDLAGGSAYVSGLLPAGNQVDQNLGGDLSGNTASGSVIKIHGSTIPAGGSLTIGNVLQVSGSSALSYAPLDLAGGSAFVSGLLPTANQVDQSLSGDLSGTTATATVIKINGTSVPATPSANQVLIASNGTTSAWSQISDSSVASSAAIAATKLAYSDGVSPALGSITVQGAIDAVKTAAVATAIQRQSQNITLGNLQGIGALAVATFNVGAALPANARVLGAEINVTQALAGLGLSVALATIQGSTDSVGSLVDAISILTTGLISSRGINPYLSRGGQQITVKIVLTGALFSALSAGALTVNMFYSVVS